MNNTNTKTTPGFITDSLPLAAYLICNSCTIKEIKESSVYGKYLFVFHPNAKIADLEKGFYSFHASVVPQAYYSSIRDVKRFLAEFRNQQKHS